MNVVICGCLGRMGKAVAEAIRRDTDWTVVAGVDAQQGECSFPVYAHLEDVREPFEGIIDFSNPSLTEEELDFVRKTHIPLVLATTGLSSAQIEKIHATAKESPVFFSSNMSMGVAVLTALTKKAAAWLGDSADIEIVEMHHNQKLDAPSGTALSLANAAKEGLNFTPVYTYDRHSRREKRAKEEIGIASLRGGTVVGEHQVVFAGHDEVLTLTHRAQSREIFAVGAVKAMAFLRQQGAGLYTMENLMEQW